MSKKNPDQNENAPRTDSSAEEKQPSRRKLLKSIAAGGGVVALGKNMPEQWAKPVIDSVVVPTHAQGTQPPERSLVAVNVETSLTPGSLLDFFVQPANAVPAPLCEPLPQQFCVERSGGLATFYIEGGISAPTPYTEGVPFTASVVSGDQTYQLTNVVISGNNISGTITCTQSGKSDNAAEFSGPFVVGTCVT